MEGRICKVSGAWYMSMPTMSWLRLADVSLRVETSAQGAHYTARMSRSGLPNRYQLAEFGALLAEPARAAGVGAATASAHLKRLLDGGLLAVQEQGRHRYYRLADDEVAAWLEA